MKKNKGKHTQFKIVNNTDSVDIDQKCIGMNIERESWPSDVRDHLKADRGLHLQIRHNRDKQTFGQANEVARLISAAPDMLEALMQIDFAMASGRYHEIDTAMFRKAIAKARGES